MTCLIDHHCHLDFPDLESDRSAILSRAASSNVGLMVTISTRVRQFQRILDIVNAHPNIFGSVGTHPHYADEELDISVAQLIELSGHPKIVAIGEAGLDYHYDNAPRTAQRTGFLNHIAAARATELPLVIHARNADADIADILETEMRNGEFTAVLHCFTGGPELAKRALDLGLYISFSGIVTFKSSDELRAIARDVPADRYLVETDAPYLAPMPQRGKRNEPAFVTFTAAKLAEERDITLDELATQTTENFFRLYSKTPREALPTV